MTAVRKAKKFLRKFDKRILIYVGLYELGPAWKYLVVKELNIKDKPCFQKINCVQSLGISFFSFLLLFFLDTKGKQNE